MRSNPINPYPRAEKEMSAAIKYGHSPMALAWDRRVNEFSIKNTKLKLHNGDVPIYRFNIKANFGQGLNNLLPLVKWQFHLIRWLVKNRKNYDLIHAYDFDTVLPALFMRMFFGKKYIYDICDFYIDAFHVPRMIKPIIKKLDFYAIRKAEKLILVNETRKDQINGSRPKEIIYIHNTPVDHGVKLEKPFTKPTIFYGGILGNKRMILETIEICKKHPEWNLVIAGYGSIEKECEVASQQYENITFLGKINYEEIIKNTLASDVIFACYDPDVKNHKYSSPNKVYEAMMCRKPIIVSKGTGVDELVIREKIGVACNFTTTSLENAFEFLLTNKVIRKQMGENSRKLYEKEYNWTIMEERLGDMYLSINERR